MCPIEEAFYFTQRSLALVNLKPVVQGTCVEFIRSNNDVGRTSEE